MPKVEVGLTVAHRARVDNATGESVRDEAGEIIFDPVAEPGPRVLTIGPFGDVPVAEMFASITHPEKGIVVHHSPERPAWVSCPERPGLEMVLAEHYGCPAGKPDDVEETHWTEAGPPGVGPASAPPAVEAAPEPDPEGA